MQRDSLKELLAAKFPLERMDDYVTRGELHRELEHIADTIQLSVERLTAQMQRWLIGIGLFLLTTFGGAVWSAHTTAIDALHAIKLVSVSANVSTERLDARGVWREHTDMVNRVQDAALIKLAPGYRPEPPIPPPK